MYKNKKHLWYTVIILLSVSLYGCGTKDFRKDEFTVKEIINGNTIVLKNGYTVHLLGVSNSKEGEEYLTEILLNNRKKIKFTFDKSSPSLRITSKDKKKDFYAYLRVSPKKLCLNSYMLNNKIANFEHHPFLQDSLQQYMEYAEYSKLLPEPEPTPMPEPIPIPKRDYGDIVIPPYTPDNSTRINHGWFRNCEENCSMVDYVCDFQNEYTRSFAVQLARRSEGSYNFGQICEIFDFLYTNWRYVNDPADTEYVSKASESIGGTFFSGDCDDFAVLMCSSILAIGGKARLNCAWNIYDGHAFAEVEISRFDLKEIERYIKTKFPQFKIEPLKYRTDKTGTWLNLDWQAAYPGGKYYNFSTIQTYMRNNGKWICL